MLRALALALHEVRILSARAKLEVLDNVVWKRTSNHTEHVAVGEVNSV